MSFSDDALSVLLRLHLRLQPLMSSRANSSLVVDGPLEIATALVMCCIAQLWDAARAQIDCLTLHAKLHVASVTSHARALLSQLNLRTRFRTWSDPSFELLQVVHVVEVFGGREVEDFNLRCPDSPIELCIHESLHVVLRLVASLTVVLLVAAGGAIFISAFFTRQNARVGVVLLDVLTVSPETLSLPVLLHLLLSLAVEEASCSFVSASLILSLETNDLLFLVPFPKKLLVKQLIHIKLLVTNVTFQSHEWVLDLCNLQVSCPAEIASLVARLGSASLELLDLAGMDVLV